MIAPSYVRHPFPCARSLLHRRQSYCAWAEACARADGCGGARRSGVALSSDDEHVECESVDLIEHPLRNSLSRRFLCVSLSQTRRRQVETGHDDARRDRVHHPQTNNGDHQGKRNRDPKISPHRETGGHEEQERKQRRVSGQREVAAGVGVIRTASASAHRRLRVRRRQRGFCLLSRLTPLAAAG